MLILYYFIFAITVICSILISHHQGDGIVVVRGKDLKGETRKFRGEKRFQVIMDGQYPPTVSQPNFEER